jgi:spermidine synthase
MKPIVLLARARRADGPELTLHRHDEDFSIRIDGMELMQSRQHESELELARLGCAHLAGHNTPRILIGGLGMGYTLRAALDSVGPGARVVVAELSHAVAKWNREFLGHLNGNPLDDKRVDLKRGDVVPIISNSRNRFDTILIDVDNGPSAVADPANIRLYGATGIRDCRRALRSGGCLAVWSAEPDKKFEHRLMRSGFHVRRYRAPAYPGSKSKSFFIWVASDDRTALPPGGGEPRPFPTAAPATRRPG